MMGLNSTDTEFDCNPCAPCEPCPVIIACNSSLPVEMCGLEDLRHEISYSIQDAPMEYIDHHIVQAAIRIARDLRVIRRTVILDMQKGVKDYYSKPIDGEKWFAIRSLKICGHCIELANEPLCTEQTCNFSIPSFGYFKAPCGVILDSSPRNDALQAIEIEMIAVPERNACKLDCWFIESYAEGIQTLAESMMRKHKGRTGKDIHSWYDPALSMELLKTLEGDLMGRYKNDLTRNHQSKMLDTWEGLPA